MFCNDVFGKSRFELLGVRDTSSKESPQNKCCRHDAWAKSNFLGGTKDEENCDVVYLFLGKCC